MDSTHIAAKLREVLHRGMTAEQAAKASYKVICDCACETGQKPQIEVFLAAPHTRSEAGNAWWVCWEAGPYYWGYDCSWTVMDRCGGLVETYWGFDMLFQIGDWPDA